jgi:hypothetical protein
VVAPRRSRGTGGVIGSLLLHMKSPIAGRLTLILQSEQHSELGGVCQSMRVAAECGRVASGGCYLGRSHLCHLHLLVHMKMQVRVLMMLLSRHCRCSHASLVLQELLQPLLLLDTLYEGRVDAAREMRGEEGGVQLRVE